MMTSSSEIPGTHSSTTDTDVMADKLEDESSLSTPTRSAPDDGNHLLARGVSLAASVVESTIARTKGVPLIGSVVSSAESIISPHAHNVYAAYGQPLVDNLDQRIDHAMGMSSSSTYSSADEHTALDNQAQHDAHASLFRRLLQTTWFRNADQILRTNHVLNRAQQLMVRPAELYYKTLMDVYVNVGDSVSRERYVELVRERMDSGWDARLRRPTALFHNTASAASKAAGSGRFVAGAIQMGKDRVRCAVDELVQSIDKILVVTESTIDHFLPEIKRKSQDQDSDEQDQDEVINDEVTPESPSPINGTVSGRRRSRTEKTQDLARKVQRRVRQRLLSIDQLHSVLSASAWFDSVNHILMRNETVSRIARGGARASDSCKQPAQMFYASAQDAWNKHSESINDFVSGLQHSMGSAWDDKLGEPARLYWLKATELFESAPAS